ncbi:hypothetical protein ACHWQZ_G008905 [Mnemiopsis leidyi]
MSIIVRKYIVVQWQRTDETPATFDVLQIDQMVDLELNDTVKRESVHKATWGTGKRRAKLWECKVLYSHTEHDKCEKITQSLIEHCSIRPIDFYAADPSDLLYSQKVLTGRSAPENSSCPTPKSQKRKISARPEMTTGENDRKCRKLLVEPDVAPATEIRERTCGGCSVLAAQVEKLQGELGQALKDLRSLQSQQNKLLCVVNEMRYGGCTPKRPHPSPLPGFGSPAPTNCQPTPTTAAGPSMYRKRDYEVNKQNDDFSFFYEQFGVALESVREQEKNTPTKLIR